MAPATSRFALRLALVAAVSLGAAACSDRVSSCNADTDYFPEKPTFEDATLISELAFKNTYVDFTIDDPNFETRKYRFVRCGCEDVAGDAPNDVTPISVPPKGLYVGDTVIMAMLTTEIDAKPLVKAVFGPNNYFSQDVRDSVAAGEIKGFESGTVFGNLTQMTDEIDLSIINGFSAPEYVNATRDLGVKTPFLLSAESGEKTPLGRAEWVKLLGLLTGEAKKADEVYDDIKLRYEDVRKEAFSVRRRPSVMLGLPFSGVWSFAGGLTYINGFLRDSNVDYRFGTDGESTSNPLSLEQVEGNFSSARYWIHVDRFLKPDDSLKKIFDDPEFPADEKSTMRNLASVKCGNVWSRAKRVTAAGGNDFFEQAVVRPEKVLEDLLAIFHPEVSKRDPKDLTFYFNLGEPGASVKGECPYNELPVDAPDGKTFYEAELDIENVDRFTVEDKLAEGKLTPAIAKEFDGVGEKDVEIFFERPVEDKKESTSTTVLMQVDDNADIDGKKLVSVFEKEFPGAKASIVKEGTRDSTAADDDDSEGLAVGAIVGIVLGSLVFIGVAAFAVFFCFKKRSKNDVDTKFADEVKAGANDGSTEIASAGDRVV